VGDNLTPTKNASIKVIIFTLEKLGFTVKSSIQQMTTKYHLPEGTVTTTSLRILLVTLTCH
jgi:hypothetical protein